MDIINKKNSFDLAVVEPAPVGSSWLLFIVFQTSSQLQKLKLIAVLYTQQCYAISGTDYAIN